MYDRFCQGNLIMQGRHPPETFLLILSCIPLVYEVNKAPLIKNGSNYIHQKK